MVFAGEGREYERGLTTKGPNRMLKKKGIYAWIDVLSRSGLWRHPI